MSELDMIVADTIAVSAHLPKTDFTKVTAVPPLIIYFRKDWQSITPGTIWKLETAVQCRIYPCETLSELAAGLIQTPGLVMLDSDIMQRNDVNAHEIVNTVRTLHKIDTVQIGAALTIGVVISTDCDQKFLRELQKTEISGVIPLCTESGITPTVSAIQAILHGLPYWPKNLINGAQTDSNVNLSKNDLHNRLTDRQQQVLDLVGRRGLSNKSIANMLRISESTVKIHVGAIMKIFGVKNRTQLALAASTQLRA